MAIRATFRGLSLALVTGFLAVTGLACAQQADARFVANTASVSQQAPGASPFVSAGPNVVGINCDVGECQASCMAGSSILLAYGFHGRPYDAGGPVSGKCGEGVEWLGACIGQESCTVSTQCKSSAMYLICR